MERRVAVDPSLLASYQQQQQQLAAAPVAEGSPSWLARRVSPGAASSSAVSVVSSLPPPISSGSMLGAAPASVSAGYGSSVAVQASSSCITDPEERCTRKYYFSIETSLAAAGSNPEYAVWSLKSNYAMQYRRGSAPQGSTREGNVHKAVIFKAKLLWIKNTLPVDLMIGSNLFRGNCYSNHGRCRGFMAAPSGSKLHWPKGLDIYYAHKGIFSPLMAAYSGLSEDDLNKSIGPVPDLQKGGAPHYMVPGNSALIKILALNQGNAKSPYQLKDMAIGGGYLWVPAPYWSAARKSLKQKVIDKLPWSSMHGLSVTISRTNTSVWEDNVGLQSYFRASTEVCSRAKLTPGIVSGVFEVVYRMYK